MKPWLGLMTTGLLLSTGTLLAQDQAGQAAQNQTVLDQTEPVPPPAYPNSDAAGPNGVQAPTQTNTPGGWRRLAQAQPPQGFPQGNAQGAQSQNYPPGGPPSTQPGAQQGAPQGNQPYYGQQGPPPSYVPPPVPAQMTIQLGTFFTVRINQVLTSDHSQQGDAFTATLAKPIVVDGFVVADRGQTIAGRVSEVDKGGRVKGVARLGVELTNLSLIDGQQVPLRSVMVTRTAGTTNGRDATVIGTTTGVGAIAGAAADGGRGAGIGAGAGLAVGALGVLLTRGRPSVIYPEMVLTFSVEGPVTFSTQRAPQAFRVVGPNDYDQPQDHQRLAARPVARPAYGGVYGPWGYPYGYYPYYYGPRIGIGFGGYYGGRFGGHGRR